MMSRRAKSSGIRLTEYDAALVKGMLARGDRQHDIAAWFGVNGGAGGQGGLPALRGPGGLVFIMRGGRWAEQARSTLIYSGDAKSVALNFETIQADPPFVPLERLEGTNLWHLTRSFAQDDLLAYMLELRDPTTPPAAAERPSRSRALSCSVWRRPIIQVPALESAL